MIRNLVLSVLCLASLGAQGWAQSQNLTMNIGGANRKYILYAPTGLPANPPLVYVIHGFNMTAQQEVQLTRMNAVADKEKFLVVYPDALPNTSNEQSWDMSGANDYNFLLAIIDSVDAKYKIDKQRVYASGFSQGGFFSFQLGCRYADVFAAIAPVSGLLQGTCKPKKPVPMIFTFGTNEGFDVNGFITSGDTWVKLNECSTTPKVEKPYPATNTRSVVTRSTYSTCKDGADVVVQSVEGGTHEWPMNTTTKINNSEEIWAFFKKFTLASTTAIASKEVPLPSAKLEFTLKEGWLRIQGLQKPNDIKVADLQGRHVFSAKNAQAALDFRNQPSGVYRIWVKQGEQIQVHSLIVR